MWLRAACAALAIQVGIKKGAISLAQACAQQQNAPRVPGRSTSNMHMHAAWHETGPGEDPSAQACAQQRNSPRPQGRSISNVHMLIEGEVELVADLPLTDDRELLWEALESIMQVRVPGAGVQGRACGKGRSSRGGRERRFGGPAP